MIKKIIASAFFLCLTIAVFLSIAGFERVSIGPSFLAFLKNTNRELNDFVIAIPDIPLIPKSNLGGWFVVLNAIVDFFNIIINILNIGADMINVIIKLIQFIVLLVKNLVMFKDNLIEQNQSLSDFISALA